MMIGFAGPRVIRESIGKDLLKGFQGAEFVPRSWLPGIYCRPEESEEPAECVAENGEVGYI